MTWLTRAIVRVYARSSLGWGGGPCVYVPWTLESSFDPDAVGFVVQLDDMPFQKCCPDQGVF